MNSHRATLTDYLPGLLAAVMIAFMVLRPAEVFDAAIVGLRLWWDIVVPALLPFFVGSELLVGLGVVHGMGVLMEPLMRPLFNIPGAGSFVLAMGLASGYPIGSVLTSRLRREGICSKTESERLMSFANTADPLFMSGAVAVGMFRIPAVAGVIMAGHYLSTLVVGFILRFYRRSPRELEGQHFFAPSPAAALRAMSTARRADGRALGGLLGDAVRNSMNTLLLIGGFIIMFSVLIRIMTLVGLVTLLARLLEPLGIERNMASALVSGLFEITLGVQQASVAPMALSPRLVAAGAIIAWSGLSVHAQVAAIIQGTDINIAPYLASRVLHSVLAALFTAGLLALGGGIPVLAVSPHQLTWTARLIASGQMMGFAAATWLAAGVAVTLSRLFR